MTRSKQRNKFLKDRTKSNIKAYCKQRNICVTILGKTKKQCYKILRLVKQMTITILENREEFFFPQVKQFRNNYSQTAFACSKLTIETLGQGVKYIQS